MLSDAPATTNPERLDYLFLNLVGEVVTVEMVDGARIEGLLIGRSDDENNFDDAMTVVLSKARFRPSNIHKTTEEYPLMDRVRLTAENIISISASNVGIRTENPAHGRVDPLRGPAPEMQVRWSEAEELEGTGESLDDGGHQEGSWDQFKANKEKFNVKSTYNEELYTTRLDRSKFTPEQIAMAERKAAEINNSTARGVQHRIERGEDVDVDEGALYSDVQRADNLRSASRQQQPGAKAAPGGPAAVALPNPKPGSYVPPSQRKAQPPAPLADDVGNRADAMNSGHPSQRTQNVGMGRPNKSDGAPPSPIAEVGGFPTAAPSSTKKDGGLNVTAKEFTPNVGAKEFVPGAAPVVAPEGAAEEQMDESILTTPKVITSMISELAKAMSTKISVKHCPPDWPGDDLFYDEEENYDTNREYGSNMGSGVGGNGGGSGMPAVHVGMGGHQQHHHAHHHSAHHHGMHHHSGHAHAHAHAHVHAHAHSHVHAHAHSHAHAHAHAHAHHHSAHHHSAHHHSMHHHSGHSHMHHHSSSMYGSSGSSGSGGPGAHHSHHHHAHHHSSSYGAPSSYGGGSGSGAYGSGSGSGSGSGYAAPGSAGSPTHSHSHHSYHGHHHSHHHHAAAHHSHHHHAHHAHSHHAAHHSYGGSGGQGGYGSGYGGQGSGSGGARHPAQPNQGGHHMHADPVNAGGMGGGGGSRMGRGGSRQPPQSLSSGPPAPVDPTATTAAAPNRTMGRGRGGRSQEDSQPAGPPGSGLAPMGRGKRGK